MTCAGQSYANLHDMVTKTILTVLQVAVVILQLAVWYASQDV